MACENICTYDGMIEDLQAWYLDNHCTIQQNMRPQLDVHHFELSLAGVMEPYVYVILLFAGLIICLGIGLLDTNMDVFLLACAMLICPVTLGITLYFSFKVCPE